MQLDYKRKPDGQKRGKGTAERGELRKKFPIFPASEATPVVDRAARVTHKDT